MSSSGSGNTPTAAESMWKLRVEEAGGGITRVTFTADMPEPKPDAVEAMRTLAAIALWWVDTDPAGLRSKDE